MLPPCSFTLLDHCAGFRIEGRGRPVLLLHGSPGSQGPWRALVERLRHSHRVITVDVALQHELNGVDSVLRIGLLPGERFHLVGHSHGVAVALRMAQVRPQRLHSLTLCESMASAERVSADDLRRVTAPTRLVSACDETASAIDRFIRGVDALDLRPSARVARHG
jgi:pimeloyl-ACP methyl ester carboxylesterase